MYDNNGIAGNGNNMISDWEKICLFWITLNSTKYNNPDEHENFPVSFQPPTHHLHDPSARKETLLNRSRSQLNSILGPEDDALVMTVCTTDMDGSIC